MRLFNRIYCTRYPKRKKTKEPDCQTNKYESQAGNPLCVYKFQTHLMQLCFCLDIKKNLHYPDSTEMENSNNIRNSRLRFTSDEDLMLLRSVLNYNPFESSEKWGQIARDIRQYSKKEFSVRTLKEHVYYLVKKWIEKFKATSTR